MSQRELALDPFSNFAGVLICWRHPRIRGDLYPLGDGTTLRAHFFPRDL